MVTTKVIQIAYKSIFVGKNSQENDFVPLLYQICSSSKYIIVSVLQKFYYKTTKISYHHSAFFPLLQLQRII